MHLYDVSKVTTVGNKMATETPSTILNWPQCCNDAAGLWFSEKSCAISGGVESIKLYSAVQGMFHSRPLVFSTERYKCPMAVGT